MQNKLNFQTILLMMTTLAAMAISSTSAFASGGGGGGFGGGGFGGASSAPRARVVDQNYEQGKAIYSGLSGANKISYCVKDKSVDSDGELVPLKRKSLKPYKRSTYADLSSNLYNCNEPDSLISSELKRDDYLYVMYYLNKRYKLALK